MPRAKPSSYIGVGFNKDQNRYDFCANIQHGTKQITVTLSPARFQLCQDSLSGFEAVLVKRGGLASTQPGRIFALTSWQLPVENGDYHVTAKPKDGHGDYRFIFRASQLQPWLAATDGGGQPLLSIRDTLAYLTAWMLYRTTITRQPDLMNEGAILLAAVLHDRQGKPVSPPSEPTPALKNDIAEKPSLVYLTLFEDF